MKIAKYIFFLLYMLTSICIATYLWKLIDLPLSNKGIVGYYFLNNSNSLNDVFGYIIFITCPILSYFIWQIFYEKKKINDLFLNIKFKNENIDIDKKIYILFSLFIIFIILEFLSIPFSTKEIDLYHEGARLSAAFKSKLDGSLWSGSYIARGVIYEILGPKYIWNFFDQESIGLLRFLDIIYVLITKLLLIVLSLEISKNTNFKAFFKMLFFILLTIIFLTFINYGSTFNNGLSANLIKFREIPVLLTLILFIKSLPNINRVYAPYFFVGFLATFSFFWSVDRAITLNILVLFIIFFLVINKSYKNIAIIIFTSFFSWLFFYFFLKSEFMFFVSNTIGIINEMSEINGLLHPIPFSSGINASRSTKTILLILISLLISFNFFFKKKSKLSYRFKMSLIAISLTSFLSYLYALGRTDYTHLKQVFGFPLIFLSCYLLFFLFYFIEKKCTFSMNSNKITFLSTFFFILLFLTIFNIDYSKIISFKNRFVKYIELKDEIFLSKIDNEFVKQASNLIKNEKCIQLYTDDTALLYLLKKPSCTKYYFVWLIGSKKNQIDLINKLDNTNFIIKNGTIDKKMILHKWGISLNVRYSLLDSFIDKNFNNEINVVNRKLAYK